MTEPIRLFAVVDSDGEPVFDYELALAFDTKREAEDNTTSGDRVVELVELRRCATCDFFDPDFGEDYGMCATWGQRSNPEGFCHRHEEKPNGDR